MQIVARLVIGHPRAGLGLQHELLDEGGDVLVADDAEAVGGGVLRQAATAGGGQVEEDLAVVFAGLVGRQRDTRRRAPRRAVGQADGDVAQVALGNDGHYRGTDWIRQKVVGATHGRTDG